MLHSKRLKNKLKNIEDEEENENEISFGGHHKSYYELDLSDEYVINTLSSKMVSVNMPKVKLATNRKQTLVTNSTHAQSQTLLSPVSSVSALSNYEQLSRNAEPDTLGKENYSKRSIDEGRERDRKVPNRSPKRLPSKPIILGYVQNSKPRTSEVQKYTYKMSDLDYSLEDIIRRKSSLVGTPSTVADSMRRSDSQLTDKRESLEDFSRATGTSIKSVDRFSRTSQVAKSSELLQARYFSPPQKTQQNTSWLE